MLSRLCFLFSEPFVKSTVCGTPFREGAAARKSQVFPVVSAAQPAFSRPLPSTKSVLHQSNINAKPRVASHGNTGETQCI